MVHSPHACVLDNVFTITGNEMLPTSHEIAKDEVQILKCDHEDEVGSM